MSGITIANFPYTRAHLIIPHMHALTELTRTVAPAPALAALDPADRVWTQLCALQADRLPARACRPFVSGLPRAGITTDRLPDRAAVSAAIERRTGFRLVPAERVLPLEEFFGLMSRRLFPIIDRIRPESELAFASEPDLWHDLFGHVPFLVHPFFADLYEDFGRIGVAAAKRNDGTLDALAALYWYTIEFGLVREDGRVKVYGAGILPSPRELEHAFSGRATHAPFDVSRIVTLPFTDQKLQDLLFVADSFDQMAEEVRRWARSHDLLPR
jgi:phenylalanine-4-hydroxylase